MEDGISVVEDLLSNRSFQRWTNGAAAEEESRFWDEWCRKREHNRQLAMEAQAKILGVSPRYAARIDSGHEWLFLRERIEKKRHYELAYERRTGKIVWGVRVAAVFLVAAMAGLLSYTFYSPEIEPVLAKVVWQHIETAYGEQKTITLSDGSSIVLSAHSSLAYPAGWVQDRAVEVRLKGEAYFSVAKRESSDDPAFKVKTPDGTVQVLGTKFVVTTGEKHTRVVLEEGAVQIFKSREDEKESEEFIRLRPSQLIEFSRYEESVKIKKVNPRIYTSWANHELVLDNTPFSFLADRIKRTYGVKVVVKNPGLYERRLTGNMSFRSLDLLVQGISKVLEIEVSHTGNTVVFGQDITN